MYTQTTTFLYIERRENTAKYRRKCQDLYWTGYRARASRRRQICMQIKGINTGKLASIIIVSLFQLQNYIIIHVCHFSG